MGMQLMKKIRDFTGMKNYGIHKHLKNELGIKISLQGIDAYDEPTARSMRLDVLIGLEELCHWKKLPRARFWDWIREEFGK
jgi:hypothetical protein